MQVVNVVHETADAVCGRDIDVLVDSVCNPFAILSPTTYQKIFIRSLNEGQVWGEGEREREVWEERQQKKEEGV